jgi:hypothetical protein
MQEKQPSVSRFYKKLRKKFSLFQKPCPLYRGYPCRMKKGPG